MYSTPSYSDALRQHGRVLYQLVNTRRLRCKCFANLPPSNNSPASPMTNANHDSALYAWLVPLMSLCIVGLLAINVATLASEGFHDALYAGLRRALLMGGKTVAEQVLRDSKHASVERKTKAANDDVKRERHRAKALEDDLEKERTGHLKTRTELMHAEGLRAKATEDLARGSKLA
jgi:hypothetical protein